MRNKSLIYCQFTGAVSDELIDKHCDDHCCRRNSKKHKQISWRLVRNCRSPSAELLTSNSFRCCFKASPSFSSDRFSFPEIRSYLFIHKFTLNYLTFYIQNCEHLTLSVGGITGVNSDIRLNGKTIYFIHIDGS